MGKTEETQVRIALSSLATHASAEELIRHFAFQGVGQSDTDLALSSDVVIEILDRDGRSGNYQPERVRISRIVERNH